VTSSQPEAESAEEAGAAEEVEAPHPLAEYAESVASAVGGEGVVTFDTVKVTVPADQWVETLTTARDELGLVMLSFVSAIDWSNQPAVGEALEEELEEETFELLATVADLTEGRRVTFSTRIPHEEAVIDSLVEVYAGANWHEREAHEMFGIVFTGHPDLSHLYLPDGFLGNPLLKSFPLLSREVKPWPGTVDVEAMPEDDDDESEAESEGDGDEAAPADEAEPEEATDDEADDEEGS